MTVNDIPTTTTTTTADSSVKSLPVDDESAKNGEASEQRSEREELVELNSFRWSPATNLSGQELTCDLCPEVGIFVQGLRRLDCL